MTDDEFLGVAWWNGNTEAERAYWLDFAGSAVPADAWACFKRVETPALIPFPDRQGCSRGPGSE